MHGHMIHVHTITKIIPFELQEEESFLSQSMIMVSEDQMQPEIVDARYRTYVLKQDASTDIYSLMNLPKA